jgi:hypothetical protein
MYYFTFIISFISIYFILNLFGFTANTINRKNFDYSTPVYGFSIIIVVVNFLYFLLKLPVTTISYILLILVIFIIFYLIKSHSIKKSFFVFIFSALMGFPIFIFFLISFILYGETLIIFRGNQWDFFFYLYQSLIVLNNSFEEITRDPNKIHDITNSFPKEAVRNIAIYLHERPGTFLNIALIKILSNLDIFKAGFLYKCILISLTANGFISIINQNKKKLILAILFPFTFWVFYIYEIDALAQLASVSISLVLTSLILDFFANKKEVNNKNIIKIALVSAALFLIYTEIFFIYLVIFIILFIFNNKKKLLYLTINKNYFKILIFFIIFSTAGFASTYGVIFEKIFTNISGSANVNYWGYYGAFLLGKLSIILDSNIVDQFKRQSETQNTFNIIYEIIKINYLNNYSLFFLNFLPSLFGLFIITIGKLNNTLYFYTNLILIIFINIMLIIFLVNLKKYFEKVNYNHKILLKSVLLTFTLLSLLFFIHKSFWQMIKLYLFISPFIYLFIILIKNKIKYFFILIICLTPIYQYSENNNGIGKRNSFPSILHADYKNKFNWSLNTNELNDCNSVKININTNRYNIQKFEYAALKVYDNKKIILAENNKKCFINETKDKFIIFKN